MIYLTGVHALNLPCDLDTCGDWHYSALKWENLTLKDSEHSTLGKYGLEYKYVKPIEKEIYVANHIRAILDFIEDGNLKYIQGFRNDFICNDKYDEVIFSKVINFHKFKNWKEINLFMSKEYGKKWIQFAKEKNIWEI